MPRTAAPTTKTSALKPSRARKTPAALETASAPIAPSADPATPSIADAPAAPEPALVADAATAAPLNKLATLVALLRRPEGATLAAMTAATGWQVHSVRGAISGALKKKQGLEVTSTKADGVRTYRIAP